ncbi:MAG: tRNA threonylcarbamoyladenosine dehydratase [Bacteroidaceae bacterium]
MTTWQQRTLLLMGEEKANRLANAHVLVVGVGGVGAYAAEMLCRAGVGKLTIVDADEVTPTNINRQLPALHSTIGQKKVDVLAARFRDINPNVALTLLPLFLTGVEKEALIFEKEDENVRLSISTFDFIVDAIDTITPKVSLIAGALRWQIPIVSSMGAGAKTDITKIQFSDIWDTYHCGLSKAVRHGLKQVGLQAKKLPVVFSAEQVDRKAVITVEGERNKKTTTGTVSYMPATFGCYLAQYVLDRL